MPNSLIICVVCKTTNSPSWWKCCHKHTTELGNDVVCFSCANECFKSKEVIIESVEPTIEELLVGATSIYDNNKKLLTNTEVIYLLDIIKILHKLKKESLKSDNLPKFCEHDPYRDDTELYFVLHCRKCPAEGFTTKISNSIPRLPQWRIN